MNTIKKAVLEVSVNNHPGVMSHVCGLFARRTYNVEGIACLPVTGGPENAAEGNPEPCDNAKKGTPSNGATSVIWLLVHEDGRLAQIIKQVEKLHDVRHVRHHGSSHPVFSGLEKLMGI